MQSALIEFASAFASAFIFILALLAIIYLFFKILK